MIEDRPSSTAQRVAERRAAHQILDHPRVFDDPLALSIIGSDAAADLVATPEKSKRFGARYLRAFMAVRSRYAEDELASAVGRGVKQYVVLGAGLDTFAYRNTHSDLNVFELDHPATQGWKRHRLEAANISIPRNLTFASIIFEKEMFVDALRGAGFELDKPAFFSWLGVTPYLKNEVVLSTLRSVINLSPDNGIVFDYAVPRSTLNFVNRIALDLIAARVAKAGEPFQGFFDPVELARELRGMGFGHIEDLDSNAINSRYFSGRTDGLRVGGDVAHLLSARG